MSVRLENIVKTTRVNGRPHVLFDGLTFEIERGERVAILGLPKSGKSKLLRIICGTERFDSGRVQNDMTTSWPIPVAGFLSATSSVAWNIRSLARIYGISDPSFVRLVGELAGIPQYLNARLSACPPFVRQQLGFALGIAVDFDLYLFDNQLAPQSKEFRETALEFLRDRTAGKSILLATGVPQALAEQCDSAYVLENGRVTRMAEIKSAQEYFKALQKAEAERQRELAENEAEDERTLDSNVATEEGYAAADQAGALLSDF